MRMNAVYSDDDLYNNLVRVRKDGGKLLLTGYDVCSAIKDTFCCAAFD